MDDRRLIRLGTALHRPLPVVLVWNLRATASEFRRNSRGIRGAWPRQAPQHRNGLGGGAATPTSGTASSPGPRRRVGVLCPLHPEDVAAYLEDRSGSGARPSTLRVAAFAIARNHRDAGFDVPVHRGVALDGAGRADAGRSTRSHQGSTAGPGLLPRRQEERRTSRAGEGAAGRSAPQAPAGGARWTSP